MRASPNTFAIGATAARAVSGVDYFIGTTFFDLYDYTASTGISQPVTAGTKYWMRLSNDTTTDGNDTWFWAGDSGGSAKNTQDFTIWNSINPGNLHFVLEGTAVPEPGTATLLLLGGMLAALSRRRR